MAQRKYTPAAKGRGFNAVTVSDANIQRMSQESNRIVEGMRARRDSDLENQRRILEDMESNAAYSEKTRQRDFKIASTNIDTQRQQQQYNAQATQDRIRQETELAAKIFDSVASLSATAAKKSQESRKKQDEKQYEEGKARGRVQKGTFTLDQWNFLRELNESDQAHTLLENNATLALKRGMDPNAVAKVLEMSAQSRAGFIFSGIEGITDAQYASFYNTKKLDPEYTLKLADGTEIPATEVLSKPEYLAPLQTQISDDFIKENGFPENAEMQYGAYKVMAEVHDADLSVVQNNETANIKSSYLRRLDNAAYVDFDKYGLEAFVARKNLEGNEPAHNWINARGTAMGPDGEFILTEDQIKRMDVHGVLDENGKSTHPSLKGNYEDDHSGRWAKLLNDREAARRSWATNQRTTERNDYQAESAAWFEEYLKNPTRETLAAAFESSSDNQQGPFDWAVTAKAALDPLNAPYIQQLKTQAKDLQARGMLNQSFVTEVFGYDPVLGNQLQKSLDEQNPLLKSEPYKAQRKTVANYVKKPSATAPFPKDSASSTKAARVLTREFDALVKKNAAAYGIEQASDDAAVDIEKKIATDSTNPEGKYYRKYDALTGLYDFPNLGKDENLTGSEATKEQAQQVQDALNDGRQQEIINKKHGVLTQTELETEIKNINKPGYVPNVKLFLASKGLSGGVLSLLNKQLVLAEMDPIEPPESLAQVGEYSPSSQKLLQRYLNANVVTRVHGYEGNKLGNEWNRHVAPAEFRDMIETHSKTYGVPPALIAAGLEEESQWQTNKPSPAGAKGMAQFMDATAAQYGVDVNDPDSSIKGMAAYMKDLMAQFGDPILAAGAYNAGPGRMQEYVQNGIPLPAETVNHMRKVTKALYKYSGDPRLLRNPHATRTGTSHQAASVADSFVGMDTREGPDEGENACVYALNKVLRASGIEPPWGNDLYVPTVKANLDQNGKQISGPQPGAIVIMQDDGSPPYPHIGIVGNDGLIISNSTSRRKFDWKGTPEEYEQYYGKPNLYYRLN